MSILTDMKYKFISVLAVILSLFFVSCLSSQVRYNKTEIVKKFCEKGYQVTLNGDVVDFKNLYLDKKNIKRVRRNFSNKTINVIQKDTLNLVALDVIISSDLKFKNVSLVVIDGILISEKSQVEIELTAVESIDLIKQSELNDVFSCRRPQGDMLLIATK